MIINHNIASLNTYRQLSANGVKTQNSLAKLSSGLRINKAGDDAAGLAISEKMRGQIRGLDQASRNAQDGISFIQTAEGALSETHSILQRMRELAVQSANDTNVGVDRSEIQKEMDQLASEITRISNSTEFNQQTLLNGGIDTDNLGPVKFHIGANEGQDIQLEIGAMDADSLGIARDVKGAELGTNTAKVDSVKADSVDVTKTLADGNYTVTVANVAAGATATFGANLGDTGALIGAGTPTADFSSTITYNHTVVQNGSIASGVAIDADTAANTFDIDFGDVNGALGDDITINFTFGAAEAVEWTGNTVNVTLSTSGGTAGTYTAANVNTLLSGGSTDASSATNGFDITAVTISNAGGADAIDTGNTAATGITGTGGVDAAAANFVVTGNGAGTYATNGTFTANGIAIDLAQVSGTGAAADNESFTITGYATTATTVQLVDTDGITNIGSAVTINATDGGEYTIGNTAINGGQMKVKFDAAQATAGDTTVTVATQDSEAASKQTDGTMSEAVSYGGINVSTQSSASKAVTTIQNAIETVSAERSKLGAYQNRLEHTINNLGTSSENLTAAESRVRDVDMAKEMMEFTKNNILSQAAQAMLAQANQQPQGVLQLLR